MHRIVAYLWRLEKSPNKEIQMREVQLLENPKSQPHSIRPTLT